MTIQFGHPLPGNFFQAAIAAARSTGATSGTTAAGGTMATSGTTHAQHHAQHVGETDQVNVPPAEQRQEAKWDPNASPWGPGLKTRDEIGAFFKARGLPEKDVEATLNYLDKVGADYAEIGGLVDKQLMFKRDDKDVLGAMQAFGVMREGRNFGIQGTDSAQYTEVMEGLKNGKVRVDMDTTRNMGTAAGRYEFEQDTIYLKSDFNLASPYKRSVLFHELIHTRQDVDHAGKNFKDKPLFQAAEVEAYKAQGEFMLRNGVKPDTGEIKGHLLLNPAMRFVQLQNFEKAELAKPAPDMAKVNQARQQRKAIEEDMDYNLSRHYDSYDKTLSSDGLRTHKPPQIPNPGHDHGHHH